MPPKASTRKTELAGDRRREALERTAYLYDLWDKIEPGNGYDAKVAEWKVKLNAESPAAPR